MVVCKVLTVVVFRPEKGLQGERLVKSTTSQSHQFLSYVTYTFFMFKHLWTESPHCFNHTHGVSVPFRECCNVKQLKPKSYLSISFYSLYSGQIHEHTQEQQDGHLRESERKSVVSVLRFVGAGFQ